MRRWQQQRRRRGGTEPTAATAVIYSAGNIYEFTPHDMPFNLPFTIRMPVPGGAPDIKVFMASPGEDWNLQPATVANGVAVSCALALAISPTNASATDTLCFGGINSTVTFTASGGTQPYSWSAILTTWGTSIAGLTVINATQAQWSDTSEYFCDYSGTVTITVTDSTGASASATIQVN